MSEVRGYLLALIHLLETSYDQLWTGLIWLASGHCSWWQRRSGVKETLMFQYQLNKFDSFYEYGLIKTRTSDHIHRFLWYAIFHVYRNFEESFVKPPSKLKHGWELTFRCLMWLLLLIHELIPRPARPISVKGPTGHNKHCNISNSFCIATESIKMISDTGASTIR